MSEQTSERETLISELNRCARVDRFGYAKPLTSQAADMLRADAEEIAALRQRVEACDNQLVEARATIEALRELPNRWRRYANASSRIAQANRIRECAGDLDAALALSTPAPVVTEGKGE